MRKFAILMTVLTFAGAFAPIAANAAVGKSVYQPGPVIVHTQTARHAHATQSRRFARGRSVYNQQINAIRSNQAG